MEQANNVALDLFQSVASQTQPPKTGKGDGDSDFRKLIEKAKSERPDSEAQEAPKADKPAQQKPEKAPAQKQEDPVERAKKLAEQGAWFTQPQIGYVDVNLETGEVIAQYQPGEYILAHMGGQTEVIPTADLEPWEMLQMQQLVADPGQVIDVSDPEADAILEATDPTVEHGPAQLLEKLADEVAGVERKAVGAVRPQAQEGDAEVELTDAEQGPQQLFHDVKAAPVKVGEAENVRQADEADVVRQVDVLVDQAVQGGEPTVTVRLDPENLGEVTVQVSMKPDGVLSVAISARNDDTRALLERHTAQLQELVSSRTQQSVEVNVQRQQESQQGQDQQHSYDGHNGHAQDGQQERRQRRGHAGSQDFMQQLRLGLIPTDGEA